MSRPFALAAVAAVAAFSVACGGSDSSPSGPTQTTTGFTAGERVVTSAVRGIFQANAAKECANDTMLRIEDGLVRRKIPVIDDVGSTYVGLTPKHGSNDGVGVPIGFVGRNVGSDRTRAILLEDIGADSKQITDSKG